MSKFKYFKVSDKLLDTELKKSELWVYLTHCRYRGIKTKGYSIAGLKGCKNIFGNKINKKVYDKSLDSLIDKELIKVVDEEVKKRFYKSKHAIEVIKGNKNIQIPIELLDKQLITDLSVEEIKAVIELYNYYEPLKFLGGIDYNIIKLINTEYPKGYDQVGKNFGQGFNRTIIHKKVVEVVQPNKIISYSELISKHIDTLLKRKLFKYKPVVLEFDEDDEDLTELKYELFKGLVGFKNEDYEDTEIKNRYLIAEPEDNKKVVWILDPVYRPNTEACTEYIFNKVNAESKAIQIYKETDKSTIRKENRIVLYDLISKQYYDNDYLYNEFGSRKYIPIGEIVNKLEALEQFAEDPYELENLESKLKGLLEQEEQEKLNIELENERIKQETGKRSRKTTSKRLKEIEKESYLVESNICMIKKYENELLDLIPYWLIEVCLTRIEY